MNHKKLLATLLALCMCFAMVACDSFGKNGYKKAVENCMDVYFMGEFSKVGDLAPAAFWANRNSSGDELAAHYYDFEKMQEWYEERFGSNFKAKYKIKEQEKMDSATLSKFQIILNDKYEILKTTIQDGYTILIEFTYQGSSDNVTKQEEVYALQIDGDWFLCDEHGHFKLFAFSGRYPAVSDVDDMWE